ncbi:MAG: radical SAM protein [Candidatus Pacearchaeota archaeon]
MVKPKLIEVLVKTPEKGLSFSASHLIPKIPLPKKPIPQLRWYTNDIDSFTEHNKRWVNSEEEKPIFKMVYFDLETRCNQNCRGCFTGIGTTNPLESNQPVTDYKRLAKTIDFLKSHGGESIVYAGKGELWTKPKEAREFIEYTTDRGLGMMIFTNGTLLEEADIRWLKEKDVSLTISLRGTNERAHNELVRGRGFRKSIRAIKYALKYGFQDENRLAVEIPAINSNYQEVLNDFLPAMRYLGIVPFAEQFILTHCPEQDKKLSLNFKQARKFFEEAARIDRLFGYEYEPVNQQRMTAQEPCRRPTYSFVVRTNGDVEDCPGTFYCHGNIDIQTLKEIFESQTFKGFLNHYSGCPCSTCYTKTDKDLPKDLPFGLEDLK